MPSHRAIRVFSPARARSESNVRSSISTSYTFFLSYVWLTGSTVNPDGAVGQIGEAVGGPFSKEGVIGSQFDASKNGIAGHVERAVDGPSNPAGSSK